LCALIAESPSTRTAGSKVAASRSNPHRGQQVGGAGEEAVSVVLLGDEKAGAEEVRGLVRLDADEDLGDGVRVDKLWLVTRRRNGVLVLGLAWWRWGIWGKEWAVEGEILKNTKICSDIRL
jgi:hypothetical protein